MTDPVQPLTEGEIEAIRRRFPKGEPFYAGGLVEDIVRLLATVEAQAEKIAEQRALVIRLSGEVKAAEEMGEAAESRVAELEAALAETRIAREVEAMAAHASDELNKHLREGLEACERYALRISWHELDRQNAQAIVRIVRAALSGQGQQKGGE